MVDLREKYYNILEICFSNDEVLKMTISYCLQLIFKKKPMAPKFIAQYIDDLMKRGGDRSVALDTEIDKVYTLSHHQDSSLKILFKKHLQENLIKRVWAHDQVSVGQFGVADCDDIMENCRIQLENTILQMNPFVVPGFPSTPETVNYTQLMREFLQSMFLQKHGERVYIAFRKLLAHFCFSTVSYLLLDCWLIRFLILPILMF